MLIENIHPKTLDGVKRLATQLKKSRGIKHSDALDLAAQAANFTNFRHALRTLPARGPAFSNPYGLLTVYWRDEVHRHLYGIPSSAR
jgi:hypothetical protein